MSETATTGAAPEQRTYGKYRSKPITKVTARFINMGDGLSKSMEIEGDLHEPGTYVCHVVRSKVGTHRMDLDENSKEYCADETFAAGTIALIDEDLVIEVLTEMERRQKERADAEAGRLSLGGVNDAADAAKTEKGKGHLKAVDPRSDEERAGA